jgi:hypothetical protein
VLLHVCGQGGSGAAGLKKPQKGAGNGRGRPLRTGGSPPRTNRVVTTVLLYTVIAGNVSSVFGLCVPGE